MYKSIDPEHVRTKLLRVSKVSLGLDPDCPVTGLPQVESTSVNEPRADRLAAVRERGNGSGRLIIQHPVGLLTRLMYHELYR